MRKQQVTMFVSLLLMVVVAAAAQTPSQLDRVNVIRDTDTIRVEMKASGAVAPKLSTLDSPARVVIDLPETVMATGQTRISVGAAGVKGVRIGMDGQSHPTTRVVVDLEKACAYELTPGPAGKLVLTLHANAVAQAAEQKTVTADASAPASRPASPFSSRVVDGGSVPTVEGKTATKASAEDMTTPNKFVVVEPSYHVKNEVKADAATEEPTARAQEAAARFSDKTAVELLPVSMHAAPQAQSSGSTPQSSTGITPAVNLAAEQKSQMGQQSAAAGPRYTGEPISVNLKDVDLKDFFRLIHEISGLNVVLDPAVRGTVTLVLDEVPWDQGLDIVLRNNGLSQEIDGNVLRIATQDTLKREADQRRELVKAQTDAIETVTATRVLSYAKADTMVNTIKKFLTPRGDVYADERTNA